MPDRPTRAAEVVTSIIVDMYAKGRSRACRREDATKWAHSEVAKAYA